MEVGGIEVDVGELDVVEAAGAERADDLVKPAQMRDTSDLEIPESTPRAATRSSTERVDTPLT